MQEDQNSQTDPANHIDPNTQDAPSVQKKILVVEDEQFIGELYLRALSRAGYDATVEIDGARALERARTDQFDIILLDLMLPTMTGMDILAHLRGPDATPQIHSKIIITTNLEQEESKREAIEHLADGYLIKANVTPRELVDFLQHIG